jgi:hypothetical protein
MRHHGVAADEEEDIKGDTANAERAEQAVYLIEMATPRSAEV